MKVAPRHGLVAAGLVLLLGGCGAAPSGPSGPTSPAGPAAPTAAASTPSTPSTTTTASPVPSAPNPSAKSVLAKARKRAKAVRSGAYEATLLDGDRTPTTLTFRGSRTDYELVLHVRKAEATLIVHGDDSYIRGNAEFWARQKSPNPGEDVFVKLPTERLGSITKGSLDSTLRHLFGAIQNRLEPEVSVGEIRGAPAWTLFARGGGEWVSVYVDQDTSDLLRFKERGSDGGTYEFHDWNRTFDIPTPSRRHVVTAVPVGG